jgi:small subunit ribosomal protein S1
LSIKQAAEGGELAEEYRQHFEMDEHGNWAAGTDDVERESAWAEYYQEGGTAVEGAATEAAEAPAAEAAEAPAAEVAAEAEVVAEASEEAASE